MNTIAVLVSAALAVGVGLDAPAAAQPATPPSAPVLRQQGSGDLLSSEWIGAEVFSADQERVGENDRLLFNTRGQIIGYIVSVGEFLAMGSRMVAIRADHVEIVGSGDAWVATTSLSRAELEAAPNYLTSRGRQVEEETLGARAAAGTWPRP